MIDLMHIGEIIVGVHAVFGHHAAHGGAIAVVVVLLDPARLLRGYLEPCADELADPDIDLLPQVDVMRVQRVVEIEHPGIDMGEGAGCSHHRSLKPSSRRTPGPINTRASFAQAIDHTALSMDSAVWVRAFAGTTKECAGRSITASRGAASCRRPT